MRIITILAAILLISSFGSASTPCEQGDQKDKQRLQHSFGNLPLYFIENQGQVHDDVAYYIKGADKTLYFTNQGITFALTGEEDGKIKRWSTKLEFVNASPNTKPLGKDRQEADLTITPGPFRDRAVIRFGKFLKEVTVTIHNGKGVEVDKLRGTDTRALVWDSGKQEPGVFFFTAEWRDENGKLKRRQVQVIKLE